MDRLSRVERTESSQTSFRTERQRSEGPDPSQSAIPSDTPLCSGSLGQWKRQFASGCRATKEHSGVTLLAYDTSTLVAKPAAVRSPGW